jgi:hypothetical protein
MSGMVSLADCVGWSATAVVVSSYFFERANAIRRVQMAGAVMWLSYGLLVAAYPVVVANVLIFGAAAWTTARS